MSDPTPTVSPEASPQPVPSAPAAPPPVSLGDEAALRASAPELARSIDARLASWDVVPATVASVDAEAARIVLGDGTEGRILKRDFGTPPPQAGQRLSVLVEAGEGQPTYSHDKADKLRLWAAAALASELGLLVEGTVVAKSFSGLSVDLGVRAFLPAAQSGVPRGRDLEELIGQRLVFGISKFDRRTGTVELARRALVQQERAERKRALLAKLVEGAVLDGVVKNLTDYGAFIDLGGLDGLLHISDMSWTRLKHPRELLATGDDVRVQVLKFDPQTQKMSLGLKQLQEDPWAAAVTRYPAGTRVACTVKSVTDFGAFLEVEPGIEGLLHVSEMSWARVKHPSHSLKVGDAVEAVILEVDAAAHRLRLGTKQLQPNPWTLIEDQYPIGSVIRSTVRSVTDFGVFVALRPDIDGLVHISDLSWTQRVRHPGDLYKPGDEIEVVVLNIDLENERISLGVKQAQNDPWREVAEQHPVGSKFKARASRITDFGVFVEIAPGIDGLIHVSELRDERVEHPGDVVQEGDELEVRVLDIDPDARKIALSLRAPTQPEDYRSYMKDSAGGLASLGEVFAGKLGKKDE